MALDHSAQEGKGQKQRAEVRHDVEKLLESGKAMYISLCGSSI